MTVLAHPPVAVKRGPARMLAAGGPAGASLRLRPTADGWSLVSRDGVVVFRSRGRAARQACLEFASEHAVTALFS